MSITLPEPTNAPASSSYDDGYTDGELAAITGLSSARVHARASMADAWDRDYAAGYIDGYLSEIERAHALTEKDQASR